MNQTANYGLPQWESSDRILMDDFNNMTEGIDAALAENKCAIEAAEASCNSAIEAVAASAGNCKVATGSYTGTGVYGKDKPNHLTFPFAPKLVLVRPWNESCAPAMFYQGETEIHYNEIVTITASWSGDGKTLSWYSTSAAYQLNATTRYLYIAFG